MGTASLPVETPSLPREIGNLLPNPASAPIMLRIVPYTPTLSPEELHLLAPGLRRWSSNPSGKCSYERPTRATVCGTMRSVCGADAGCSAMDHQSLCTRPRGLGFRVQVDGWRLMDHSSVAWRTPPLPMENPKFFQPHRASFDLVWCATQRLTSTDE